MDNSEAIKRNKALIAEIEAAEAPVKAGPPTDYSRAILKLLERADNSRSTLDVFRLWLDVCNLCLDDLPGFVKRQEFVSDEDSMRRWREAKLDKISSHCYRSFAEAFALLLCSVDESYPDILGAIYMSLLEGSRWNKDQFYTPQPIALMMAQMSLGDIAQEFSRRSKPIIEADPVLQALVLSLGMIAGVPDLEEAPLSQFVRFIWPLMRDKIEPFRICDPCCGSGVLLLAAASQIPRWLIDIHWVEFYGVDINHTAVQMARLNMRLYGLGGRCRTENGERMAANRALIDSLESHVNVTQEAEI